MKFRLFILLFVLLISGSALQAQTGGELTIVQDTTKTSTSNDINPLAPAKAAFFSGIFPGLGQAYNKKYWKMPIVYGAIGASSYFYIWNNKRYHEFRDIYKRRLAGYTDDRYPFLSDDRIIQGQKFYQKNRDLSALITAAFYVLNIIDANVDAHLKQFNVDDNLTFSPSLIEDDLNGQPIVGFTLNYKF